MNLWSLFAGRDEATDRLLARHQDVQRMAQQIDRHVRVEAIQVEERCLEAPGLRVAVGHRDDPREVTHLLEELLPLRDQLILRKLNEHFLPPARRQRSIGNAHISLSPPSTGPSLSRGYRSDHFHWNARVPRGLIRIASTRTRRIECSRPRAGGPRRIQDTQDGGRYRFRRMWLRGRLKRPARLRPVSQETRSTLKGGRGGVAESATGLEAREGSCGRVAIVARWIFPRNSPTSSASMATWVCMLPWGSAWGKSGSGASGITRASTRAWRASPSRRCAASSTGSSSQAAARWGRGTSASSPRQTRRSRSRKRDDACGSH